MTELTQYRSMADAAVVANYYAARNAFSDYRDRKGDKTVRSQDQDLANFGAYLNHATVAFGDPLVPESWAGLSWGIVDGYVRWQLDSGYSISTVNRRLSTLKTYAKLAAQAGIIGGDDLRLIDTVKGYGRKEAIKKNAQREVTRVGSKKATAISISDDQAEQMKMQPDTPQGRRDAVIMALLLDHGLRVGELAILEVEHFDLTRNTFTFYRPKVSIEQTHELSRDTATALRNYIASGDCPAAGLLLRGSRRGGGLTEQGMSVTAITERAGELASVIGVDGVSAHDCRHYWATRWAGKVDVMILQEAGGWSSLAMPRRYVERAKISNKGMV